MSRTSSGRKAWRTWELQSGQPNLSPREVYRVNPPGNHIQAYEEDGEQLGDLERPTLIYLKKVMPNQPVCIEVAGLVDEGEL